MQAEAKNAVDKDATEPIFHHYWHTVRQRNPKTLIRPSRMILSSKNAKPEPSMWLLKGRIMFTGHTALRGRRATERGVRGSLRNA